jgi:hypothetical protein
MFRRPFVVLLALGLAGLVMGCAASPRSRPLQTSPIGDSLQQVRKQLEGTWELVSLDIYPTAGSQPVRVAARGTLVYDAYGNLEINGEITDAAYATAAAPGVLVSTGRAAIDVANRQIRLLDVEGNMAKVTPEISASRTRRYAFEGDLLRLTSLGTDGRVTAVATWKKR